MRGCNSGNLVDWEGTALKHMDEIGDFMDFQNEETEAVGAAAGGDLPFTYYGSE